MWLPPLCARSTRHPVTRGTPRERRSSANARATPAKSTIPVSGECSAATPSCVGLDLLELARSQPAQPGHAVLAAAALQLVEARHLGRSAGHDQLAAALVRDPLRLAVLVHAPRARHAQPGFQRSRLVVDAGMDHPAVVAGLVAGDVVLGFDHGGTQPGPPRRELARHRQPDYAAAHDRKVALAGSRGHG